MTGTCVQIVGGRNSNVLLNGFRYSKCKVNKNGSIIWSCRVPGCKCKLTSGADLNVIRNPCPDQTYSTDTDSTAVALLVNNMRKRAREKILPIPQIYEQERRKMLITGLDVAPADISTASQTIPTVFVHNCTDNVGILYHRHQQQLVTSGSEMNGVQRQLVII